MTERRPKIVSVTIPVKEQAGLTTGHLKPTPAQAPVTPPANPDSSKK